MPSSTSSSTSASAPPTFGTYDTVLLDDVDRRAVYLSEGLGHAFCALADNSTVTYLCSTGYNPSGEHGINPLDPELGIEWPTQARDGSPLDYELSQKDTAAPGLTEARESGLLPNHDDVAAYLRGTRRAVNRPKKTRPPREHHPRAYRPWKALRWTRYSHRCAVLTRNLWGPPAP